MQLRALFQKVHTAFMNQKLAVKLNMLFVFLLLLALSLVVFADRRIYSADIQQATVSLFREIAESTQYQLEVLTRSIEQITAAPLYNTQMQEELVSEPRLSDNSSNQLSYAVRTLERAAAQNSVIFIFSPDGAILYSRSSTHSSYLFRNNYKQWTQNATELDGSCGFFSCNDEQSAYACTAVRLIKETKYHQSVGVISVTVPTAMFEACCSRIHSIANATAVILDVNNNIIYQSSTQSAPIPQPVLDMLDAAQADTEFTLDEGGYLGHVLRSNGYSILTYTDYRSLMYSFNRSVIIMSFIAVLICMATTFLTSCLTAMTMRPIKKFVSVMNKIQNGDHTIRFRPRYHDEIGIAGQNFDSMLDRLDEMKEHLVNVSTSKKHIEIDALKSQINPHFLYNTLDKIRMMAISQKKPEIANQLCLLAKLLRYNVTTLNEMTTLDQELEYLGYYLQIQNSGRRKQIVLITDVPDTLMDYPIIKLILQPIVENAISHALFRRGQVQAEIRITGQQYGEELNITIHDNGVGIPPERLSALRNEIYQDYECSDSKHIGLRNVHARIRLFYGARYGLAINSTLGCGTTVQLKLPGATAERTLKNVESCNC